MVKPSKTKKGTWRASIYIGKDSFGRKKYKDIYGKTEEECTNNVITYMYERNNNLIEEKKKIETFEYYFDKYIENKENITENTRNDYKSVKKNHLQKLLKMKITDINEDTLQELYKQIKKDHGSKLLLRVDKFLNAFFNSMVKKKKIKYNYLNLVEKPSEEDVIHAKISNEQITNILELLKKEEGKEYWYILILIQSCLGTRISEGLAIDTVKSIDWDTGILKIIQQQTKKTGKGYYITTRLKTKKSRRSIPILLPILKEIKEYLSKQNEYFKLMGIEVEDEYKNLLFLNNYGSMIKENTAHRHWKEFKEKYNIDPNLKPHDFRRYFATWLLKNNVPDKVAKSLLGHEKIEMTQYYQNDDLDFSIETINNLKMDIII